MKEIRKKLLSKVGIPMLRDNTECLHVKYKIGSNIHTCIKELKIHSGASDHIEISTCLNITYKELMNGAEIGS